MRPWFKFKLQDSMKLLIDQIEALIKVFKPLCGDTETLVELEALLHQEKDWPKAHYLSTRIRAKTLKAIDSDNRRAEAQYYFEEICAQTIYNLSQTKMSFASDTPYWVIPMALKFARALELDPRKIIDIAIS
jgi:hypothetical protein